MSRSALQVQQNTDTRQPQPSDVASSKHEPPSQDLAVTRALLAAQIAELEPLLSVRSLPSDVPRRVPPHEMLGAIEAALSAPDIDTAVEPKTDHASDEAERNLIHEDSLLPIRPFAVAANDEQAVRRPDAPLAKEETMASLSALAPETDRPRQTPAEQPETARRDPSPRQDNDARLAKAVLAVPNKRHRKKLLAAQEIITLRHDVRPELAILTRAAGVVLMMLLVIAFARTATADDRPSMPDPGMISVTGTGHVTAAPDLAIIRSGVVTSAPAARDAVRANTEAMSAMVARLKDMGIADRDLQTSGFSINPQYQHFRPREGQPAPPPKIVAYEVRNMLTVRIRDLDATGSLLDAIVTDGANQVDGISFTIDDTTGLMQTARERAVADARARAEVLTAGLGVTLGRVLSISEGQMPRPSPQPRMARMEMAMAADSAPVPVEAGEQQLTATISVTWELDQ